MIANRNRPWDPNTPWSPRDAPFVEPSEAATFLQHQYFASYLHITIHELFGHGTGKLLAEESPRRYNFDIEDPPTSPLTGKPIRTWYKPGQTWTGVFGNLATSMEECRAECVGSYLITEPALLEIFGYTEASKITADDSTLQEISELPTPIRALFVFLTARQLYTMIISELASAD
jgi:dipeptidyl-peptidase-3